MTVEKEVTRPVDQPAYREHHGDLARKTTSAFEVFGQSLAATGPSIAVAGTIAGVYLVAGKGTIYSYIVATIVVVLVASGISQFARRTASAGSLYTYTSLGLGRGSAFAGGWGLIFGYLIMGAACLAGSALYVGAFLTKLGFNAEGRAWQIPLLVIILIVSLIAPIRGVRISTRVSVVLEIVSLIIITILLVALLVHQGLHIDTSQLKAKGASTTGIALGTVLAVGAFCGFESSASLGLEARKPHRAIPRALIGTALVAGVLYIVAAYGQVLGFGSAASIAESSTPLNELASSVGIGWLAYFLDLAIAISAAACTAAMLNAAARSVYSLGREKILPANFGRAHSKFKTPHTALYTLAVVLLVVPVIMVAHGTTPLNIFVYLGTISAFGFLLAYALVSVSVPIFLARRNEAAVGPIVASVLATVAIVYVFYKNLVPVPPSPYNTLPYIFGAWVVIGIVWYLIIKVRDPERAALLGSFQESAELEGRIAEELSLTES